jgi:L-amino acid N-acyltransferase YncA
MTKKAVKKQTAKQLLKNMARQYEQLYFELWTMQAVVIAQKDASLIEKCANALDDKEGRQIVKDRFAEVQKNSLP